jgi:two-component system LytT family response regulator
VSGKTIIASKMLKYFEENLPGGFIRIHKQTIVNQEHIRSYYYGRGGYVLLSDDTTATVSARHRSEFLKSMNLENK